MRAAKMSFLQRVSGLSLRDVEVRSSDLRGELRVELLLLGVENNPTEEVQGI